MVMYKTWTTTTTTTDNATTYTGGGYYTIYEPEPDTNLTWPAFPAVPFRWFPNIVVEPKNNRERFLKDIKDGKL